MNVIIYSSSFTGVYFMNFEGVLFFVCLFDFVGYIKPCVKRCGIQNILSLFTLMTHGYNGYNDTIVCHVAINETSRSSTPSIYEIVNRFC